MQSRASLLALAASLEATAAELAAKAATIRAGLGSIETDAPSATVTLDEHIRRTGQNRRQSREWFARAERDGFRVTRLGHALSMDRDEWQRAVDALASKLSPKPAAPPTPAASRRTEPEDDSPAALLARAGLVPGPQRPRRRAA